MKNRVLVRIVSIILILLGLVNVIAIIHGKIAEDTPTYNIECVHGKTVKRWSTGIDEVVVNFWTSVPDTCTKDE